MQLILATAWTASFGIIFVFVGLAGMITNGLVIVAKVSARGDALNDAELEGRWGPGRTPAD